MDIVYYQAVEVYILYVYIIITNPLILDSFPLSPLFVGPTRNIGTVSEVLKTIHYVQSHTLTDCYVYGHVERHKRTCTHTCTHHTRTHTPHMHTHAHTHSEHTHAHHTCTCMHTKAHTHITRTHTCTQRHTHALDTYHVLCLRSFFCSTK